MKKSTILASDIKELWQEHGECPAEVMSALESIASEPAPAALKQKLLKKDFQKQPSTTAPDRASWLIAPLPASVLAVVLICAISLTQVIGNGSALPEGEILAHNTTAQSVSESELIVAIFESGLGDEFIFDIFGEGFLSLEDTA
jgi:hypothetical protein